MNIRDVVPRNTLLEGTRVNIDLVLNKEIEVTDWQIHPSKLKTGESFVVLQFKMEGKLYILLTSSRCIIEDIVSFESIKGKMAFEATIIKLNKIYVFK